MVLMLSLILRFLKCDSALQGRGSVVSLCCPIATVCRLTVCVREVRKRLSSVCPMR